MQKKANRSRRVELDIDADTWAWATREGVKNKMGQREFMTRWLNLAALTLEETDAGEEV